MNSIPENRHPNFLFHINSIKNDFDFLIKQFGFLVTLEEWVSREYTTIYQKDNLLVEFLYESSCESRVCISNKDLPYDEGKKIYNFNCFGKCDSHGAKKLLNALVNGTGVIKRSITRK